MPAITKQDLSAAFRDVELCDLLESKGLCPTILRSMLEKLFLRSLVNRLNRESLIEEAKMRGIKNYKEVFCLQLWNYNDYTDSTNIKRIRTCNKKKSSLSTKTLRFKKSKDLRSMNLKNHFMLKESDYLP